MQRFRLRRGTYTSYSIGCAIVWAILLATTQAFASKERQHTIVVTCGGWWIGWTSATIARVIYPPPKPNRLNRRAG
jgi:hypothetical protein